MHESAVACWKVHLQARLLLIKVLRKYFRKLHEAGVQGHEPESAYYFMPNFTHCHAPDIKDGQQLCDKFLDKANVALQPCDPHYLVR